MSSAKLANPSVGDDVKVVEATRENVLVDHSPRMQLGEGILYRESDRTLHYLDIERSPVSALYIAQLDKDGNLVSTPREVNIDGSRHVTALALRKGKPGSYLCTTHTGLAYLSEETGKVSHLPNGLGEIIPSDKLESMRFNDAISDSRGRFYFHSMNREGKPEGKLYMYDKTMKGVEDLKVLEEGFAIGNGPAIDEKRGVMYFNDTEESKCWAYDWDAETGLISNKRLFYDNAVRRPGELKSPTNKLLGPGGPDGLTLDSNGNLYQAVFGRGIIERFTPQGVHDLTVKLPARAPTCPVFGGDNGQVLFVTTASEPLQPGEITVGGDQGGNIIRIDLSSVMNGSRGITKPEFDG